MEKEKNLLTDRSMNFQQHYPFDDNKFSKPCVFGVLFGESPVRYQ